MLCDCRKYHDDVLVMRRLGYRALVEAQAAEMHGDFWRVSEQLYTASYWLERVRERSRITEERRPKCPRCEERR